MMNPPTPSETAAIERVKSFGRNIADSDALLMIRRPTNYNSSEDPSAAHAKLLPKTSTEFVPLFIIVLKVMFN